MPARLKDFEPLRPAEQMLVNWIVAGNRETCVIGSGLPPRDAPEDVRLRASFVRYLALGGCDACRTSEKGLRLQGAFIEGDGPAGAETRGLDLEGCRLPGDLALFHCRIPDLLLLRGAEVRSVFLSSSILGRGLKADRLEATGGVFLRDIKSTGEVRLLGARLGGDLEADGATFTVVGDGVAFVADRLEATGGVFLRGITATGAVRLLGARLGGQLAAVGATFTAVGDGDAIWADRLEARGGVFLHCVTATGAVRLLGVEIGGNLECDGVQLTAEGEGKALNCDGMRVAGTFILRGGARIDGVLDLTGAEIGHITDDPACWPQRKGDLVLDRCRYGAFVGSPVDAASRIRWLSLQDGARRGEDFWPQPWEECARVLREMGHGGAAREVLIEKERRQRAARRARVRQGRPVLGRLLALWLGFWDWVLGWSVRYGRQPLRAFLWLALVWAVGLGVFGWAAAQGDLKPNLPQLQRAPEWVLCGLGTGERRYLPSLGRIVSGRQEAGETQYACFLEEEEGLSYPRFVPWVYSADTLIPVVSLEMQSYWIPDDTRPFGRIARAYLWLHIGAGWALSLLAVAGFSGLIRTDNTK